MTEPPDLAAVPAAPLLEGENDFASLSHQVGALVTGRPISWRWAAVFGLTFAGLSLFFLAVVYLLLRGVGIWGINIPVAWGFAIANFVWWIGIGHAGTFISAISLLMRQQWRASINRFAEAMTLFAVACAGMFPLLHLGRPWLFYWLMPYPDTMNLWPQFRSALVWDLFAVGTYFTVSLLFWYLGMLPDLATLRDTAPRLWQRRVYGVLAMGWRGSIGHWRRYQMTYLILAGLATPLVISVHSVVSLDFAIAMVPGWHSGFFPPYFVAGAIFSGFAMVIMLAVPLRRIFNLHNVVTARHLDVMAKLMLTTGLLVAYSYVMENFIAWYSGNQFELETAADRWTGAYAPVYLTVLFCNVVAPQALWFARVRRGPVALFVVACFVQFGMWLERVMIVITSLYHDYMPSAWAMYYPTLWDWLTLLGTLGLFLTLFILFTRTLPMLPIAELRELVHKHDESEP